MSSNNNSSSNDNNKKDVGTSAVKENEKVNHPTSSGTSTCSGNQSTMIKRKFISRRRRTSTFAIDGTSSLSSVVVAEPNNDNDNDIENNSNTTGSSGTSSSSVSASAGSTTMNTAKTTASTCTGATATTKGHGNGTTCTGTSTSSTSSNGFVRDPIFMYSSLIAGIGSGVVSGIACAPLDLIKTRMQIWGSIVNSSSSSSSSSTSSTTSSTTSQRKQQQQQVLQHLKIPITNKNNVVGIRTIYYMLQDIVKTEGIIGCFRGLGATLVTVPAFWGVYCKLNIYIYM
jgi:Mitochondrial carrier protein